MAAGAAGAGLDARGNLLEWLEGAQGGGKRASSLHLAAAPPFPASVLRDFTPCPRPCRHSPRPSHPPQPPTTSKMAPKAEKAPAKK